MSCVPIPGSGGRSRKRARQRKALLRLEWLEGRITPSTFLVVNAQDAGEGSLRWALEQANAHLGDDGITFDPSLAGGTIELTSGGLVADDTTGRTEVTGPGAASLTVAGPGGAGGFTAFAVGKGARLDLSGLTVSRAGVSNQVTLTLTNCTVKGNQGDGVFNSGTGTAALTGCTVAGNQGGGVGNRGILTLANCAVKGNQSNGVYNSGYGGYDSTATLTGCTVAGNQGNGVYNDSSKYAPSTCTVASCTVAGNQLSGVYNNGGATLTNCTVAGNQGRGVYNFGTAKLTNSTVAGNQGGGVNNEGGNATLTNCTVAGNQGVGLFIFTGSASAVNSILWGNLGAGGRQVSDEVGTVSVSHSIVQGGWAGEGNSAADPLFLDARRGDYRLRPGSPAIDSGDPAAPSPGTDGAGNPRVIDGDRDRKAVVDLGAYEFGRPFVTLSSLASARTGAADRVLATFSAPVSGFTAADVVTSNATVSGFQGGGARYSFTLTPVAPGPFGARVAPGAALDAAGASSTASNALAGRLAPRTFLVSNGRDAGVGSLRWALDQANAHLGDDVVRFSPALAGKTIHLSLGLVANDTSGRTEVVGPGAALLTVAGPGGAGGFTAFAVRPRARLDLSGLTVSRAGVSSSGTLTLANCTVKGNQGYGVTNFGTATLTNCTVAGNQDDGVTNFGTATLTNCTVARNGIGGITNGGTATLTNCTVAGNQGAGVSNYFFDVYSFGTATLTNCTVKGNQGDGVSNFSYATVTNCTVAGNRGAGVSNHYPYGYFKGWTATLTNCILWGNGGATGAQISGTVGTVGTVGVSHSLVQGGWPGQGNSAADPLFVDAAHGDYRLRPGSPAIDAGGTAAPGRDADGKPRLIDGNGDGAAAPDLGAYEFSRPALLAFQAGPPPARAFEPLAEVVVQLRDAYGFPVPLAGRLVTLSLPGGLLAGALTARTDAQGRAVFRGLKVLTAGAFRLRASSPGLADAWSAEFAVAEGGPPWARLLSALGRLPDRLRDALQGLPWPGL